MEDFERDLEKELRGYSSSGDTRNASRWSMILVDQYGSMRRVAKFRGLMYLFMFIFLLVLAAGSAFAGLYFYRQAAVDDLDRRLKLALGENAKIKEQMDLLMARVAIAEASGKAAAPAEKKDPGPVRRKKQPEKKAAEKKETEKRSSLKSEEAVLDNIPVQDEGKRGAEKKNYLTELHKESAKISEKIDVDSLSVSEGSSGHYFNLSFVIRNISQGDSKVEGRIFVMLQPEKSVSENVLMVPLVSLNNGVPDNIRKGQYFSIARFKKVKFRVDSEFKPDFYKNATIFVYDDGGGMVLKKTVEIKQ